MTKIFAHRGYSKQFPENTMIAFEQAIAVGAEGIELDVHLTKDDVVVVIHDETLERTTNGTGAVKDLTFAEIRQFDAAYKWQGHLEGVKVPSLEEVLQLLQPTTLQLNIELKNDVVAYSQLEEKVIALVKQYRMKERVVLSSFSFASMKRVKEVDDTFETALLYSKPLLFANRARKQFGADGLHPNFRSLPRLQARYLRLLGVPLRPYTVNKREVMERLLRQKVAAIITDVPPIALNVRKQLNSL